MHSAVRLLVLSQISLWFFLFVCFVLLPHFLLEANEGGVSNYGVHTATIIPYTLAFMLAGLLLFWAASVLPKQTTHRRSLQWVLGIVGSLYLLTLESTYPYQVNNLFDSIHMYAAIVLFLIQLLAAVWIWHAFTHDTVQNVLFAVQIVGLLLLTLTLFGVLHVLFIAETVTGMDFGILLVHTVRQATSSR